MRSAESSSNIRRERLRYEQQISRNDHRRHPRRIRDHEANSRPGRPGLESARGGELYTTSITLAEIRYGIERLPAGRRRDFLKATADDIFDAFEDQVLSFDAAAAEHYPVIVTRRDRVGLPIDGFDAQIAAICHTYKAAVATRISRTSRTPEST